MDTIENTLPEHLILEEILPRLPVKSILRFKSVSKSWLSTIISPKFTKTHLQISSFRPQFLVHAVLNASGAQIYLLQYDQNNCKVKNFIELEFDYVSNLPVEFKYIVGSCNGLVCLTGNELLLGEAFYVCNPATRCFRKIMIPGGVDEVVWPGCVFGYESLTDDYKIFGAFLSRHDYHVQFFVFSLKVGYWKKVACLDENLGFFQFEKAVLIGDTIYIFAGKYRWKEGNFVVGFDLITEQLKKLSWMNWLDKYICIRLLELRGCLSLLCSTDFLNVEYVRMLKDSSDTKSWQKLFSINLTNVLYCGLSEIGKCLLHFQGKLRVFDPSRETPQMSQGGVDFDNNDRILQSKDYIESLVSPF